VLVVDDAADCADAVCALLRRAGFESQAAAGGREALDSILQRAPDLVILDLAMPRMSGVDLLTILRSYTRLAKLPVIVYAALGESVLARRAQSLGVNRLLVKSQTPPGELVELIRREFDQGVN
jgi:CheY-like chemotaxis protein